MTPREIMELLYEGFVYRWMADSIESGSALFPQVYHETNTMLFKEWDDDEEIYEVKGACALGYAYLSVRQDLYMPSSPDVLLQSIMLGRIIEETTGSSVRSELTGPVIEQQFQNVCDNIVELNDDGDLPLEEIVEILRRRVVAIQRTLSMPTALSESEAIN